jgi:hypothetical protein
VILILYAMFLFLLFIPYIHIVIINKCDIRIYSEKTLLRYIDSIQDHDDILYISDSNYPIGLRFIIAHICIPFILFVLYVFIVSPGIAMYMKLVFVPMLSSVVFIYMLLVVAFLNRYYAKIVITRNSVYVRSILTLITGKNALRFNKTDVSISIRNSVCFRIVYRIKSYYILYIIANVGNISLALQRDYEDVRFDAK